MRRMVYVRMIYRHLTNVLLTCYIQRVLPRPHTSTWILLGAPCRWPQAAPASSAPARLSPCLRKIIDRTICGLTLHEWEAQLAKIKETLQKAGNAILTVRLTHVIARYCQASQTRGCADSAWSIAWRVSVHTPTQAKTPRGGKRRQMLRHAFPTSCETRRSLENCTEQEKQWANEPLERHSSLWRSGPAKDKHRPTPRSADLNLTCAVWT